MQKLLSLILVLSITFTWAGYLEPPFEEYLNGLADNALVRSIVIMADQVDIGQLDRKMSIRNADLQERHYVIVSALMNKCLESQRDILSYLHIQKNRGNVLSFRSFWLSNSIAVICKKSTLLEVAARHDVDIIYQDLPVAPIDIGSAFGPFADPDSYEWGLAMIRADSLWRKGVTGLGRLGFVLDVGVYLHHRCLLTRWRGRNGALPEHAWKDAIGSSLYPYDPIGRGSHICGTLVGGYPGDTVGVAFGGQWIANNAINQGVGAQFDSDIREAYNWAADPDGEPSTVYDVPDASCNSWGVHGGIGGYLDCDRRWNREIFNLEAAGCLLVFGAGGMGPVSQSLVSPANICTTYTLNYSVGSVDSRELIASNSSRGPTDCTMYDSIYWIKPEVVAPGVNIRSCYRTHDTAYTYMSGSSFANAHLAGAFMLLRQYNTNATPDTIKKVLMYTARDKGQPGEDNIYGWGIIDCAAALQAMPRGPSLAYMSYQIFDDFGNGNNNGLPDPGERVQMVDTIWSSGGRSATGITGILRVRPGFNYVVIEDSTATFGDLDSVEGANRKGHNNPDRLQFRVLSNIPDSDSILPFVLALRSNSGTYRVENIYAVRRGYEPVSINIEKPAHLPTEFDLNVVSPARKVLRISCELPGPGHVTLKLYNVTGSLVKTLFEREEKGGIKMFALDSKNLGAGIYFLDLGYNDNRIVKKVVLID